MTLLRGKERELVMVCAERERELVRRESSSAVCDEIEGERVWFVLREKGNFNFFAF